VKGGLLKIRKDVIRYSRDLAKKLEDQKHMSPFEHAAEADTLDKSGTHWANPKAQKHLWGFTCHRAVLEKEDLETNGEITSRNSQDEIYVRR